MKLLEALLVGATALINRVLESEHVRTVVAHVVREASQTGWGKAAVHAVKGVLDGLQSKAYDLTEKERDIHERARRDGRYSPRAPDDLAEIKAERDRLREQLNDAQRRKAAEDLDAKKDEVKAAQLDEDELAARAGLVTAKVCPECGDTMRLQIGAMSARTGRRNFYWQCNSTRSPPCRTITYDPADSGSIIRPPNPDFDTDLVTRRAIWTDKVTLAQTHDRVRSHLGDKDEEMLCPQHLTPMKLMETRSPSGLVLNSYEYVCRGVNADGRACTHRIPIKTMPQAAEMLRRNEGVGIIH